MSKHNKVGMIADIINLNEPRNNAHDHAPGRQDVRGDSLSFEALCVFRFHISEGDSVVLAVYSVPMCALVGFIGAKTTTRRGTLL